jgi:short-subunit dehydrogenase
MALCPGWVRTEFHERAGQDAGAIPRYMWLDADALVRTALGDFRRRRAVSIPDIRYKTVVGVGRLVPRRLATRLASRAGRR